MTRGRGSNWARIARGEGLVTRVEAGEEKRLGKEKELFGKRLNEGREGWYGYRYRRLKKGSLQSRFPRLRCQTPQSDWEGPWSAVDLGWL